MLRTKSLLNITLAFVLLCSTFAFYAPVSNAQSSNLGNVSIGNNATISLSNMQLMPYNDQQVLAATILFENKGNNEIAFVDYWLKFRFSNGSTVSPSLVSGDKAKDKVLPGTTQTYTFYTTVSSSMKYSDVSVQIIKWDFSLASNNYQRVLGTIKAPANYSGIAQSGQSFTYGSTDVQVDFEEIYNFSIDDRNKILVVTNLKNNSTRSLALPPLKYYLVTKDNILYQMNSTKNDHITLQPKIENEIELSVEIPDTLVSEKMHIILAYSDDTAKVDIPLRTYELDLKNADSVDSGDGVTVGVEKEVLIGKYKYGVKLDSVQRLPWEDEDVLLANVTLTNKNNEAAPIPNFTGIFSLDNVKLKEEDVKKVQLNNLVAVPLNGKVQLLLYTKIPFNNTMTTLGLELLNNITIGSSQSSERETVIKFETDVKSFSPVSKVLMNNSKKMTTLGKSSTIKINRLQSYTSNNTRIYNVLLELQNNEKRMTAPNKLTGYFKTTNDSLFPVHISEFSEKISPSGKVMYSIHAKLPENFNTNGMTLVLGELIDNDSAYNNATEFILPAETGIDSSGILTDLSIYPYNLSIDNIRINLTNNAEVKFRYTLSKDQQYEYIPEGHSIVMELVDDKLNTTYTQEFKLGQDFVIGTKESSMTANMNIDNPASKIMEIDGFTINIYDQFEGHKKKIASRKIHAIFID